MTLCSTWSLLAITTACFVCLGRTRLLLTRPSPPAPTLMVRRALDAVRDVGEASYYDYPDPPPISALCARAPAIMCSAARPGWAYDPYTREQRPLKQFSPSQQNQLWQYAVSNGQALKKSMGRFFRIRLCIIKSSEIRLVAPMS